MYQKIPAELQKKKGRKSVEIKKKNFTFMLYPEQQEKIRNTAKELDVSINSFIWHCISLYLKKS